MNAGTIQCRLDAGQVQIILVPAGAVITPGNAKALHPDVKR